MPWPGSVVLLLPERLLSPTLKFERLLRAYKSPHQLYLRACKLFCLLMHRSSSMCCISGNTCACRTPTTQHHHSLLHYCSYVVPCISNWRAAQQCCDSPSCDVQGAVIGLVDAMSVRFADEDAENAHVNLHVDSRRPCKLLDHLCCMPSSQWHFLYELQVP